MQGSRGSQSVVEALRIFQSGLRGLAGSSFSNANDCHGTDGKFCGEGGTAGSTVSRRVDSQIPEASKTTASQTGYDGYLVQTKGTFKTKGPWRTAPVYPADMRAHVVDHVKTMLTLGTRVRVNGKEITLTQEDIDAEGDRILGREKRNAVSGEDVMPFAGFEDFDDCVDKMLAKGEDMDGAERICGALKARHEGKSNMNDCHDAQDGKFCEGGGSSGGSMPKSGSGTSRPSVAIKREGKSWRMPDGKELPKHLEGLKIPPAWTDTQINPDPEGNLLVTGHDAKGRLQYVYSPKFMETQKAAKFARISALDKEFDDVKAQNEANRLIEGKREEADCMRVVMETGIRPGSDRDTKAAKQAYGATTLRGEHVKQTDKGVRLQYTGKKGVSLDIPVEDPDTASMLVSRAKAAGPDGRLFDTDSSTLLEYSHTLGSGAFKVKDMRTYVGTSMAKAEIAKIPAPTSKTAYKKAVSTVAKAVSKKLGNTPSVALKSYIAPEVFDAWPGREAFANAEGREPLFDFDIMIGTACKLREKPIKSIKIADELDPDGQDEDGPCPPDVRMALGFDPDELDEDKSHQVCIGNHCFFGNSVAIAPSEHIAVLQGLNSWVKYARPFGPQSFYYGADDFRDSTQAWEDTPVVFAQQHPAHRLVTADLNNALASVRAHDGGPGRIAGHIRTPLIVGDAKPDLMAEVVFDDPYVQAMHAANRLALSTGFTAGHDDDGYLTETVRPNHLLVFVTDEANQPRDPSTGFLNKGGSDVTDEEVKTAPAEGKPKPVAKPDEGSTDSRLKALIADLLAKLDEVFGSAEQLSEEAGDAGDPDPAVSGKGQVPAEGDEDEGKSPFKRNMNENHDETGRFASGGGSSGGKSGGKAPADDRHGDTKRGAMSENAFRRRDTLDRGGSPAKSYHEPDSSKVSQTYDWHHDDSIPQKDADLADSLVDKSVQGLLINGNDLDNPDAITNAAGRLADTFNARSETGAGKFSSGDFKKAIETEIRIRAPDGASEDVVTEARWGGRPGKGKYDENDNKSNADYPFDDCIADQLKKGYDQAKAEKICGYIKAKNNLQEMRAGRSPAGSDPEEDIMGAELDALKSKLDAANKELDDKKKELDAANQKLAVVAQAEKDAAWENMKSSHVPKGWLAGTTDEEKANKEKALREEFETAPVGFANKILTFAKGKGGQDKSTEEGAAFGNKGGDGNDVLSVTRELRASSGRR